MENPPRLKALKLLLSYLHMNTHCQSRIWLLFSFNCEMPPSCTVSIFLAVPALFGEVLEALRSGGYLEKEGHWEVDIDETMFRILSCISLTPSAFCHHKVNSCPLARSSSTMLPCLSR